MAKQIIAVTGIKHNGEFYPAGEPIDPMKFTKTELKELHDNGAIVVEDNTKPEDVKLPETPETPEPKGPDTKFEAPKAEAKPEAKDAAAKK